MSGFAAKNKVAVDKAIETLLDDLNKKKQERDDFGRRSNGTINKRIKGYTDRDAEVEEIRTRLELLKVAAANGMPDDDWFTPDMLTSRAPVTELWRRLLGGDPREAAINNLDVSADIHRRFEEQQAAADAAAPTKTEPVSDTKTAPQPAPPATTDTRTPDTRPTSGLGGGGRPTAVTPTYDSNDLDKSGDVSDAEIRTMARRKYPQLAWLIDDPRYGSTVGAVIIEATRKGWGQAEIDGALAKRAPEWTALSDTAQAYEAALRNPAMRATFEQRIGKQVALIGNKASQLGLTLDSGAVRSLAELATKFDWSDGQLTTELVERSKAPGAALVPGTIAGNADTLAAKAGTYLLPMPRSTVEDWARRIASGQATEKGFDSFLVQLAKGRFPHLSDMIDQGTTPAVYFSTHQAAIAKTLDRAPSEIDLLNDPEFSSVTDFVDAKGLRRSMTLSEAQQFARSKPIYSSTREYKTKEASFVSTLLKEFGAT